VVEVEAETEPAHYEKLLAEPQLENLQQIIHLQTLFGPSGADSLQQLENQLEAGVYSLFYLVKALQARGNNREHIDIVLVSDYVHEVTGRETFIHPANAALAGLGKVVNMENFNLKCRTLDIDQQTGTDRIITEINAGDTGTDYKVAFRCGQRYVEELIPIDITHTRDNPVTIKPDGVYIITGGTGGLGLQIARYLAGQNKVNLALINRSPMPRRGEWPGIKKSKKAAPLAEKINAIEEIEKKGAHVLCCCADVAREAEIRETIRLLRNQFGKINGIIHCAAVGTGQAGKPVKDDDKEVFRQVMAPKVQGTWILDRLTREDQPDFFVLFSSSITLMGGMGSGSYTAGNTYLNAFASYRGKAGLRTTAICWAAWEETLKKQHDIGIDKGKHLFRVQSTAEILRAFSEILAGDRDVPVVITGRLNYKSEIFYLGSRLPFRLSAELRERVEKYREHPPGDSTPNENRQVSPVKLKGREDGHYQQLERQIAQVYGEFLGYPEISIYDNFYELGGDSIIAAKMVRAANQLPGVNLVVEDLLRYPTVKELANLQTPALPTVESAASRTGLDITPVEKKDYYPVSDFQEALFVFSQLRGSKSLGTANNLPSALLVESEVDGQRIGQIFQQLVDRHEALRTSFCYVGKTSVQRIHDRVAITMDNIEVEPGTGIASLIKDFVKPFDLGLAPLLNVRLVRLGPGTNRYLLLIDMHHITADGQSGVNLIKDFFDLYGKKRLTPLSIQFIDYLDWFGSPYNKPVLAIQERYWLGVFKDGVPELHMPLDRPRPWLQSFKGDSVSFESSAGLKQGLNETAAKNAATLFMVLLAVLDAVLFKYTGDEDIVIGIAAAGRRLPQLEPLVGSFVNILAVRNSPGKQQTFKTLLEHVKVNLIRAFENQDYPFGQLAKKLDTAKELGRNPICDVTMALQNQQRISMEIDGLVFSPQPVRIDALDIDLNFNIKEEHNRLSFRLEYCSRLYKRETASTILTDYINALENIIRDDTIAVKDITKDKNIQRRRHEQ
jgi:NAD(P)-dependent dehydrogenase (short-subunit alcohol dehydrogenase family)/acyl carrier protein